MRVFLRPAGNDACAFYRLKVPSEALWSEISAVFPHQRLTKYVQISNGVTGSPVSTSVGPLASTVTPEQIMSYDAIVFQRPCSIPDLKLMRDIRNTKAARAGVGPRVIAEIDDNYWEISSHAQPDVRSYFDRTRLELLGLCLATADRIVTSTAYLAGVARVRTYHRDIRVARNALPMWAGPARVAAPRATVVFSGGPSHTRDLSAVAGDVHRACNEAMGTSVLIGHDYRDLLPNATYLPWTESMRDHYARLGKFAGSIGLAPLEDTPFNMGKSDIRIQEYLHAGLRVLASNVGPYTTAVPNPVTPKRWRARVKAALQGTVDSEAPSPRMINDVLPEWRNAWLEN